MSIDGPGQGTSMYHYDVLDRLRNVEGPTPEAFLFDPASNLLEALDGQEATDAQASRALPEPASPNARRPQQTPGNRLKRQGNRRFTYDARGNRIEEMIERGPRQGQVTRYSYNAQNQLVQTTTGTGAHTTTTRYAYDALGRRISKTTEHGTQQGSSKNNTISTTTFYWNGDVLLGEINEGVSNPSTNNTTKPSRTYLFEPFSFKPLALFQNNEVFHYHTDHIGTPREITNARAEVVWSSTFKTYGALALAHVNELDNPLRFQGQYYDSETGLHYNRHRYYAPNCGQFTTQDPIGLLGGMNAYQYAPNPMTWVDPWGLSSKEDYGDGAARVGPTLGVLEEAVFAQVPAKSTKAFSEEGKKIYSQAAGRPINTVDDLTQALKQGVVNPSQVPLDYVVIDGQKVIANTRSSTALINAGIPKSQWYGVDKTGKIAFGDVTFDDLVQKQLNKNYGGSVQNARR